MKKIALSCLCLFIFAGMSFSAEQQKNTFLENFAVGYSQIPVPSDTSGTNNVSSLAGRYWFNKDMGLDITLGFQTGDGDDVCMLGGKFLGKIYTLKNLDIYCLGGIQFANEELSGALSRLLVVVENYPQLKADKNFIQLMDNLESTENRISISRKDYNDAVQTFNTRVKKFPANIFASMFGFERHEYFEADEGSLNVPEVSF